MAYVQLFLPPLHWTSQDISAYMSQAMEMLWKTKSSKKALRLLKMDYVCSPRKSGGLNVLNLHFHALAKRCHCCLLSQSKNSLGQRCLPTCLRLWPPLPMVNGILTYGKYSLASLWGKFQDVLLLLHCFLIGSRFFHASNGIPHIHMLTLSARRVSVLFFTILLYAKRLKVYNLSKVGIRHIDDVVDD